MKMHTISTTQMVSVGFQNVVGIKMNSFQNRSQHLGIFVVPAIVDAPTSIAAETEEVFVS